MIIIYGEQSIELAGAKSTVLAEAVSRCKKISLDIQKIKKPDKVYAAYHIPEGERLIAYCKGTLPLIGLTFEGLVFTDRAFYPIPRDTGPVPSNRVSYDDLCSYLVTQESSKSAVCLQQADHEYHIYDGTLIRQNTTGQEIQLVLNAVQTELCRQSPSAKQAMDSTVADALARAKEEMRHDVLSPRIKAMLNAVRMKQAYCDGAVCLLAEDIFRQCDSEGYQVFLAELSADISAETKEMLASPPVRFSRDLLKDLSNPHLVFSTLYLNRVYYNLRDHTDSLSQTYLSAYALVCMRSSRCDTARETVLELIQRYGVASAYLVEDFVCLYGSQQMQEVFSTLCKGEAVEKERLDLRDGLGLTPLHYAMILQKAESLKTMLLEKDWSEEVPYLSREPFRDIYAYPVLTCMKSELDRAYIFLNIDPEIKMIADLIRQVNQQEEELTQLMTSIYDEIDITRREKFKKEDEDADVFEIEALQQKIFDLYTLAKNISATLDEIPQRRSQAKKDMTRLYKAAVAQSEKTIQRLRSEEHPIVKFFLHLFENDPDPVNLEKIFSAYNDYSTVRMYQWDTLYFMLPETIPLDFPYRTVRITADGIEDDGLTEYPGGAPRPDRLYGHSWFSPQAHADISVLKGEYRKLAKQYHPDICGDAYAEKVFAEIAHEYETLCVK